MANILVLGAGIFQVPLIKESQQQGHKTLVATVQGDYPGIKAADIFLEADTTDVETVTNLARKHNVDAILTTGTDVSIPTLAAVCNTLNLKGPSIEAAKTVSSKTSFRRFLNQNNFNCPSFITCTSPEELISFYQKENHKIVTKPDDASGSRGVSILDYGLNKNTITEAYYEAQNHSRNGKICAESFIEGREIGGDAFLVNGQFVFFTTTCKHMKEIIVSGHTIPDNISEKKLKRIKDELLRVTRKLNYTDGPLNFDVIISETKATILEMGLRNGGNGITDIIKSSYGIDLNTVLIDFVTSKTLKINQPTHPTESSSYVFGSDKEGMLTYITPFEDLKKKIPQLKKVVLAKEIGQQVKPFVHNANLIGYFILDCGKEQYEIICQTIQKELIIEVETQ
ncbi:MAG: ATP-grasp domain-containing protein [bacterium]